MIYFFIIRSQTDRRKNMNNIIMCLTFLIGLGCGESAFGSLSASCMWELRSRSPLEKKIKRHVEVLRISQFRLNRFCLLRSPTYKQRHQLCLATSLLKSHPWLTMRHCFAAQSALVHCRLFPTSSRTSENQTPMRQLADTWFFRCCYR